MPGKNKRPKVRFLPAQGVSLPLVAPEIKERLGVSLSEQEFLRAPSGRLFAVRWLADRRAARVVYLDPGAAAAVDTGIEFQGSGFDLSPNGSRVLFAANLAQPSDDRIYEAEVESGRVRTLGRVPDASAAIYLPHDRILAAGLLDLHLLVRGGRSLRQVARCEGSGTLHRLRGGSLVLSYSSGVFYAVAAGPSSLRVLARHLRPLIAEPWVYEVGRRIFLRGRTGTVREMVGL
jgi:hypothetical protein